MIKHVCNPNGGGAEALPLDDPRAGDRGGHCGKTENLVVVTGLPFPPFTNGDRIRAMSDEELGRFLAAVENRRSAAGGGAIWKGAAHAIEWLKQPAEEEK